MQIGIPKEIKNRDYRVALTPEGAVECPGFPCCSLGFSEAAPYLADITRWVRIGPALVQALPLREMVDIAAALISEDPLALLSAAYLATVKFYVMPKFGDPSFVYIYEKLVAPGEVFSMGETMGDVSLENGFAVSIEPGCNGIEASIVLIAAILAFPAPWKHKFIGLLAGLTAIQGLNLVRIISLFYLGQWNMDIFEWAHLYLWQALIMLDALVVFIVWVRYIPASAKASPPAQAAP